MIEVLLCSVVTILPDFLYRRFVQGKRLGRELTLYSIWYELRYGITACLGLTILLLDAHPLFPSVDFKRGVLLPHSADPARGFGTRGGGLCRAPARR